MKSINDYEMTAEVIEQVKDAVGGKCSECEGKPVIKPANSEELSKAVIITMRAGGEITTLAAKNKHTTADILVDMSAMNSIVFLDEVAMTVRAQAGCKISEIIAAAEEKGLTLGAIPAGSDSTVEDWVYKEEPGVGSYKYGTVKDNVYNIVAVGASGDIIESGYDRIGYYMSGYNLIQTLAASNGKLALVTEVTFKLYPAGVTKPVAYEFPDIASMAAALNKIVQEPSVKPLHISFARTAILMAFQGEESFVNADIEATDAICTELGGSKLDGDFWSGIQDDQTVALKVPTAYIGLKDLAAYIEACKGIADFSIGGNIPDRSTAVVKLFGDVKAEDYYAAADKAIEMGGRSCCRCKSKFRTEETKTFMKRIEDGFMGKMPAEPKGLGRQVTPEIIALLKEAIGAKNVNDGYMDRLIYSHDLAPLPKMAGLAFNNVPDVIARVESVAHIAAVMKIAYKYGIPVTPRGNSTWGLGGSMPTAGGIIIDMTSKFKKVLEINTEEMYVRVQAGCTWKNLYEACLKKGYLVGSMPSSFPSGTIGAWISTNGMGIGSYKYGSAKDNVMNAQIVLDNGDVVVTGYNGTGSYGAMYNLNQFFSGAEGTLGMLGEITFRIYPLGEIRCLAYEFDNLKDINDPIQDVVRHPSIRPLHIAWSDHLHFENQKRAGLHVPDVANLWLVTLQGDAKHNDMEEAALDAIAESHGGRKVSSEIAEHEWEERCYEFRARKAGVGEIPGEVIVPTTFWGTFTEECYNGFEVMKMDAGGVIGVMVDRSTTLFMPYYFKDDELMTGMLAFGFNFYLGDRAAIYGGRSTGLGVFFAWMLDVIHDGPTAARMRELKTNMDPHDVVNPGHVVCGMTRFGVSMSKPLMSMGSMVMQTMKKVLPKDSTFGDNIKRFRYNDLEHIKTLDRVHKLGDGTQ
jgi:glycolate oxidase